MIIDDCNSNDNVIKKSKENKNERNIENFILSNVSKTFVKQKTDEASEIYTKFDNEISKHFVKNKKSTVTFSSTDTEEESNNGNINIHFKGSKVPNIIKSSIKTSKHSNQSNHPSKTSGHHINTKQSTTNPIFTPNKSKLYFNFVSNDTSQIICTSYIIYNSLMKINDIKIINDCFNNLSQDKKSLIDLNMTKLVIMNTLGFIIEISSNKDNIQELLSQYISNVIHLCIYVFDLDLLYEMNNSGNIMTVNLLHKKFSEDHTGCNFAIAGIRYPYVTYVNYEDNDQEKTLEGKMKIASKHYDLKDKEFQWMKINNCTSSLKDLTKYTMVKVETFDMLKRKEVILLAKARKKEIEGDMNEFLRLIIKK